MENMLRDPALNRHLSEKGYIRQQLLSDQEISSLMELVHKYYPEEVFLSNGQDTDHARITTSYRHDGVNVREHISNVIRDILTPRIQQLFSDYRIIACGLFVKAPKGGWLDLHYHPTVVEDPCHWVIDIWCPLQDTDLINGTLCVVPGSHRIFPWVIDFSPKQPPFYQGYAEEIRKHYSVPLPAKAGEAVMFEDSLLHWSPQNMGDTPRYAIHCTCIPQTATTVYVYTDPDEPGSIEMYEVNDRFFIDRPNPMSRQDLTLLKVIPNKNQSYTYDDFKNRLERSDLFRGSL